MAEPLTHSKTGELCYAYNKHHMCASHSEHMNRWLPHVCCCGYEWELEEDEYGE